MALEIACDESGYEGEKLIGTNNAYFAHGSVRLDVAASAALMAELRDRIRSPATEYKANHVLREKHRRVLEWVLGPDSPLWGNANVFVIDKAFYAAERAITRFEPDPLVPAIVRAVSFWGNGARVRVVHDRTNTLTPQRIARIEELCAGRLAGFALGDSFTDPRIQVADIIAGIVRKLAPANPELISSFVDSESIWPRDLKGTNSWR